MSRTCLALSIALLGALAACGDNGGHPDAGPRIDSADTGFPPAPRLGAQLARIGRPQLAAALIGTVDPPLSAVAKRDAYGALANPATWATSALPGGRTVAAELAANQALFDALDQGAALPCTGDAPACTPGCGNQLLADRPPAATSYARLAALLADDQLYVDTTRASCDQFLALELEVALGIAHTACGGRAPRHDVIDVLYALLFAGRDGVSDALAPVFGDGVDAHADVSDDRHPYFAAPHP